MISSRMRPIVSNDVRRQRRNVSEDDETDFRSNI